MFSDLKNEIRSEYFISIRMKSLRREKILKRFSLISLYILEKMLFQVIHKKYFAKIFQRSSINSEN